MKYKISGLWLALFLFWTLFENAPAQPVTSLIEVLVAPDHPDWTYQLGEEAHFTVQVQVLFLPPVRRVG